VIFNFYEPGIKALVQKREKEKYQKYKDFYVSKLFSDLNTLKLTLELEIMPILRKFLENAIEFD